MKIMNVTYILRYTLKKINKLILGIAVSLVKNIYSFDKIFVFIIMDLTEKKQIEKALNKKEHFAFRWLIRFDIDL